MEPEPTWNGQTRIDFALVPNQLLQWFRNLEVDHNTISDHSRLIMTFEDPEGLVFRSIWKTFRDSLGLYGENTFGDLTVTSPTWSDFQEAIRDGNVEAASSAFTTNFESWLGQMYSHIVCTFPLRSFMGRGKPTKVSKPLHTPMVSSSRHGEEHIEAAGHSVGHMSFADQRNPEFC